MLHLVCECQPLQTQHFFIFLFASFGMWLLIRLFANLRYSYSMKHLLSSLLLVFLAGYFGFQVSARQLSAESGAERASKRRTNCGRLIKFKIPSNYVGWLISFFDRLFQLLNLDRRLYCVQFNFKISLSFVVISKWIIRIHDLHLQEDVTSEFYELMKIFKK